MLTTSEDVLLKQHTGTELQDRPNRVAESLQNEPKSQVSESETKTGPIKRMLRLECLGQTVASICWIVSVFFYGIEKTADWLQVAAASAWLLANIATIIFPNSD